MERFLRQPFSRLPIQEQLLIKQQGRPKPNLENVLITQDKSKARTLSSSWYERVEWLTGSLVHKKLYCWPCVLFSQKKDIWSHFGYCNLKNLSRSVDRHEKSEAHVECAVKLKLFGKESLRIDLAISEAARISRAKRNEIVRQNRHVLGRLIDITCMLGRQELPFRGHYEAEDSVNQGNYREMFKLFTKHDEILQTHMTNSKVFKGLSKSIQNDLISVVSELMMAEITEELDAAPFFALEMDETTDVSTMEQCSIILRYVDPCGRITERFFGFHDVSSGRDASSLATLLDEQLSLLHYRQKLVAQSYDGAAVMASDLNGLQAKVKKAAPSALFVHCHAHRLNLVISSACNGLSSCRVFFSNIAGIPTFFHQSTKRTNALDRVVKRRMPANAPTRWNFKSRLIATVKEHRNALISLFDEILHSPSWDALSVREAYGFLKLLEDFGFLFWLHAFDAIFSLTSSLFDILQSKSFDIGFCRRQIQDTVKLIRSLRCDSEFQKLYDEVHCIAGDPDEFPTARRRLISGSETPKSQYRRSYFEVLDLIITQFELRFLDLDRLKFVALMDIRHFENYTKNFPDASFASLQETYPSTFDFEKLKNELHVVYAGTDFRRDSLSDLLVYLIAEQLTTCLSEVCKLASLIATIPVSTASAERSFSCLKRVKTYCRNTMGQERLSGLAMMAIERELLLQLEKDPHWYDRAIHKFASMKNRRADFFYE